MTQGPGTAPKVWSDRLYEDLDIGEVYYSIGRTITASDNVWFTCLTMNTNQIHFNTVHAERTRFARPLVNSTLTLALVTGLSVSDTSENAVANLGWGEISLPRPVFVGDTIWAESEVLAKHESHSSATVGIVTIRSREMNHRREVVIEFKRTLMLPKRDAAEHHTTFPGTEQPWTIV